MEGICVSDRIQLASGDASRSAPRAEARCTATQAAIESHLVGCSAVMRRVRARLTGLAPLDSPVLLLGECGTGLSAAAQLLHRAGSSATGTLRRIDCARFDVRQGVPKCSALYLDGVEAFTPAVQAYWGEKLVEFERRDFHGVPRILASATPRFLHAADGACDERLRRILMRFSVTLPPLRDRRADVPRIADALASRLSDAMGREARLTADAHDYLSAHNWHGNIRQLEELLERAVAFSGGGTIHRQSLVELVSDYEESVESIRAAFEDRERLELLAALKANGGNITLTAQQLGKSRGAVYRLIEKHGISLRQRN